MASEAPDLVLIHGGWHTSESLQKLTKQLREANTGYKGSTHTITLPSVSETRPPTANLDTDTAVARSYISDLISQGKTVLVLAHSYGGQVASNALHNLSVETRKKQGLTGGVCHIIYMAAFALPEGKSMVDKVKEFGHEELLPLAFDFADDMSCIHRDPKTFLIGPGVCDAELDAYIQTLKRWNGKCMYQGVTYSAWREIPVSYVYTTLDMTVPWDYQKSMVEGMRGEGREVRTFELETGHCPGLTMTGEVVRIVREVAEGL